MLKSFPKKWLSSTLLELRLQPRPTPIVKVSFGNDFRGVRFIKRRLLQCASKKIHQLLGIKSGFRHELSILKLAFDDACMRHKVFNLLFLRSYCQLCLFRKVSMTPTHTERSYRSRTFKSANNSEKSLHLLQSINITPVSKKWHLSYRRRLSW